MRIEISEFSKGFVKIKIESKGDTMTCVRGCDINDIKDVKDNLEWAMKHVKIDITKLK